MTHERSNEMASVLINRRPNRSRHINIAEFPLLPQPRCCPGSRQGREDSTWTGQLWRSHQLKIIYFLSMLLRSISPVSWSANARKRNRSASGHKMCSTSSWDAPPWWIYLDLWLPNAPIFFRDGSSMLHLCRYVIGFQGDEKVSPPRHFTWVSTRGSSSMSTKEHLTYISHDRHSTIPRDSSQKKLWWMKYCKYCRALIIPRGKRISSTQYLWKKWFKFYIFNWL